MTLLDAPTRDVYDAAIARLYATNVVATDVAVIVVTGSLYTVGAARGAGGLVGV